MLKIPCTLQNFTFEISPSNDHYILLLDKNFIYDPLTQNAQCRHDNDVDALAKWHHNNIFFYGGGLTTLWWLVLHNAHIPLQYSQRIKKKSFFFLSFFWTNGSIHTRSSHTFRQFFFLSSGYTAFFLHLGCLKYISIVTFKICSVICGNK